MLRLHSCIMDKRFLRHLACSVAVALLTASATPARPSSDWKSDGSLEAVAQGGDEAGTRLDENASTKQLIAGARSAFIADDYALAEMLYKSVLIREPDNLSAMLELAVVYEASGQLQYARGLLTRALIISPYDEDIIDRNNRIVKRLSGTLEAEVDSLLTVGAHDLAVPKLAVLLTTQPENADLYYKKAQCHLKLGHPEAALVEIDKALNLQKDDRYYDLKARAQGATQEREINQLALKATRALHSGAPEDEQEAMAAITRILELDPQHTWAKERFLALTDEQGGADSDSGIGFGLGALRRALLRIVRPVGRAIVDLSHIFNGHLELLLLILLVLLILHSPFTHMLIRGFSPRQSLSGRLEDFSIQEILSLVNTHHRTGVLRLQTPSGKGQIFFDNGEICHCRSAGGTRGREALQRLIKEAEQGLFVFKDAVTSSEKTVDTPLSLILLELPEREEAITAKSILKKQKRRSKMKSLLGNKS